MGLLRRLAKRRVLTAVILAVFLVLVYVVVTFVQVWAASRENQAGKAGAIVVLGAAQYNGRPSPVLAARLDHALDLYHDGVAPLIVVTGGRQQGDRFTEATTGYNYLRDHGVPDDAIRKEVQGRSTYESIAAAARFLHDEGVDGVVLVSGRAQSKRMEGIAAEVGLDAQVSPAGSAPAFSSLVKETIGVSVGRVIGYRRLENLQG
ncbi:MAG: YdcF family protein [Acidimicrobiales bacterium]|nr:YdcF family protein [Acidimicrobiales bacterium]